LLWAYRQLPLIASGRLMSSKLMDARKWAPEDTEITRQSWPALAVSISFGVRKLTSWK
jgi:hypothetical protein